MRKSDDSLFCGDGREDELSDEYDGNMILSLEEVDFDMEEEDEDEEGE